MQAFDEICAHDFLNIDIDTIQHRRQEYPHSLKFVWKTDSPAMDQDQLKIEFCHCG